MVNEKEEKYVCACCGEKHGLEDIHKVKIKGEVKNICKECADTIHGLI